MWKMARVMAVNTISIANTEKDKFIIIRDLPSITETFRTGITNLRGFFDLSNFLFIMKLISEPLTLRLLCCSRLRSNEKCLVDQLLLGQNLLKNVFNSKTFLN